MGVCCLVRILPLTSVDHKNATNPSPAATVTLTMSPNQAESGRDLAAVMKLALSEEQKNRERLLAELTRNRELLQSREQQAQQLQEQQANLRQQFSAAQTNVQSLSAQLHG